MRQFIHISIFFLALLMIISSCSQEPGAVASAKKKEIQPKIQSNINEELLDQIGEKYDKMPFKKQELLDFYAGNANLPAWYQKFYRLPQAAMLIKEVEGAAMRGMDTSRFPMSDIRIYLEKIVDTAVFEEQWLREHDVLLSNLFLHYVHFERNGLAAGEFPLESWNITRTERNTADLLKKIINSDPDKDPFSIIPIQNEQYQQLAKELEHLNELERQGGWNYISFKEKKLEKGMAHEAVKELRQRLAVSGDLEKEFLDIEPADLFDENIVAALKKYQERNGLDADGVLGGKTLQHLNVPVQQRIQQVQVNMERWKWLPDNFEEKYVMVNIPEFKARAFKNDSLKLEMKVIVGQTTTVTPIFKDTIEYIVANPYWNVPYSIASREILPHLKFDPSYIYNKHMEVRSGSTVIDPYSVDWSRYNTKNFPYQIRQKPGSFNSLGLIKFMFPNKYSVYMHDTNAPNLFSKSDRTLSHGCIRVSKPMEYAEFLLQEQEEWSTDSMKVIINSGKNTTIPLKIKVPVYILYFTVWVDDDGVAHYYRDHYWRDQEMISLLFPNKSI